MSSLTAADLTVAFTMQAKKAVKGAVPAIKRRALGSKALTYTDFLELLKEIAPRVYRELAHEPIECFRRLLMENILPLAARRHPIEVEPHWTPEVVAILGRIDGRDEGNMRIRGGGTLTRSLRQIFQWYSKKYGHRRAIEESSESHVQKRANSSSSKGSASLARSAAASGSASRTGAKGGKKKAAPNYEGLAGYMEIMKFCEDYCCFSSDTGAALLTTVQAADIYLSSAPKRSHCLDTVPDLNEACFLDFILRMAIVAYSPAGNMREGQFHEAPENKLKALLLHMWKAINHPRAQEKALNVRRGRSDSLTPPPPPPDARTRTTAICHRPQQLEQSQQQILHFPA